MSVLEIIVNEYFYEHPIIISELIDDYVNKNRLKILDDSTKDGTI